MTTNSNCCSTLWKNYIGLPWLCLDTCHCNSIGRIMVNRLLISNGHPDFVYSLPNEVKQSSHTKRLVMLIVANRTSAGLFASFHCCITKFSSSLILLESKSNLPQRVRLTRTTDRLVGQTWLDGIVRGALEWDKTSLAEHNNPASQPASLPVCRWSSCWGLIYNYQTRLVFRWAGWPASRTSRQHSGLMDEVDRPILWMGNGWVRFLLSMVLVKGRK